jgi:hypothetical protein
MGTLLMSDQFIHEYLLSRGWTPGRVTRRRLNGGRQQITWWRRGDFEYPQFLALDLERFGWIRILETMPPLVTASPETSRRGIEARPRARG